jgi:membrane protein implicated in regulation of membrane protease activity
MDSSGNRAVAALLAAVVVLAGLVVLFGYPFLISVAVIAAFAALAFIVVLSAGDTLDKPSQGTPHREAKLSKQAAIHAGG